MFIKKPNPISKIININPKNSDFFNYCAAVRVSVTTICTPVVARRDPYVEGSRLRA